MPAAELLLAQTAQAKDLATLLSRARSVDPGAAVRLQARNRLLAVWVPVMAPETLLDQVPTVLGMRALSLREPAALDAVVSAESVLDRLARITTGEESGLSIPPVTVQAAWTGAMPTSGRWETLGEISHQAVVQAAREGAAAVEQALPQHPGSAVLGTVRSRIWSTDLGHGLVSGACFGAEVLGFTAGGEEFQLRAQGQWRRLSCPRGHVLARPAQSL